MTSGIGTSESVAQPGAVPAAERVSRASRSYAGIMAPSKPAGGICAKGLGVCAHDSFELEHFQARYLSNGPVVYVDGIEGVTPSQASTCFHRVCAALGLLVPRWACRVADLSDCGAHQLQSLGAYAKVYFEYSSRYDEKNHVMLVSPGTTTARLELVAPDTSSSVVPPLESRKVGVTSLMDFFDKSSGLARIAFFSGEDLDSQADRTTVGGEQFGADLPSIPLREQARSRNGPRDESIVDLTARHGTSNVTSGVVRPRRRVVASKSKFNPTGAVAKSYVASTEVMFNNLEEIFLDKISRDYAQQILEELFSIWGVDTADPDALKFAEDLVWAFVIATTASNKANYNKEFDIPQKSGSIVVGFQSFSLLLSEGHGVTRRQFARATADDMLRYNREPENFHLLPRLATRVGCDPQMAAYAFDGSTHCSGMTSAELSFTKLLERRNLFEDDSVLAEGASQRLLQGMSSGPRSIISR